MQKGSTVSIYSITPFTMLDFPDNTACIIWFAGCNMTCHYCYNPEIVCGKGRHSYDDALAFLDSRKGLLDGVVLSGGECTLHPDIRDFALEIHKRGFKIKLDTNGSKPEVIASMVRDELLSYIALDFKAPFFKYSDVTGMADADSFDQSLRFLVGSNIPFEVRTTYHSALMNEDDLLFMQKHLLKFGYRGAHFIQNILDGSPTLNSLPPSSKLLHFHNQILPTTIRN